MPLAHSPAVVEESGHSIKGWADRDECCPGLGDDETGTMGQQLPCYSLHRNKVQVRSLLLTLEQLLGRCQEAGNFLRRVSIRADRAPVGQFEQEAFMPVSFGDSPDRGAKGEPYSWSGS